MVTVRLIRQTDRQLSYVNTIHVFTLKRKKPEVSKYIWREMLVKDAKKLKDKSLSKAAFKRVSHFPLKNGAWPKRWDGCHSVMKIQEIRVKSRKKKRKYWLRGYWKVDPDVLTTGKKSDSPRSGASRWTWVSARSPWTCRRTCRKTPATTGCSSPWSTVRATPLSSRPSSEVGLTRLILRPSISVD